MSARTDQGGHEPVFPGQTQVLRLLIPGIRAQTECAGAVGNEQGIIT
jgi:hypothetical protein